MKTIVCLLLILVCSLAVFPHASFAQNSRPMVRLIYFLPNDRAPDPDIDAKMDGLIKDVQQFYANQLARHGFGRKTFQIETDARGNAVVHRVRGRFSDEYYSNLSDTWDIWEEIEGRFDTSENIYLTVIDMSSDFLHQSDDVAGQAIIGPVGRGGEALITAAWMHVMVAVHELGHVFGLLHDFRDEKYIMWYLKEDGQAFSECAVRFLSVSPFFNPDIPFDDADTSPSIIKRISPQTYPVGSTSVPIQLEISDPDGLHQVFLVIFPPGRDESLKACHNLAGETEAVVEFDYDTSLSDSAEHFFFIYAIDKKGNKVQEGITIVEGNASQHIATLESGRSWGGVPIAFSPDGMSLAAGAERGVVKIWDVTTRTNVATFGRGPNLVWDVAFSPDGAFLAVSNYAGGVELWDVATWTQVATFETGTWSTYGVAFSPDGELLAVGTEEGVELWDVATRRHVDNFEHGVETFDVAFSPDGLLLASGDRAGAFGDRASAVELWDVATGRNVATFLHEGISWVRSVAFSPDGLLLASSHINSFPGLVKMWDVATQRNIANFEHVYGIESVAFSPSGAVLASAGDDNMVKLWDVTTGIPIAILPHASSVDSVAFSPNGAVLASGTDDGTIELWDMSSYIPLLATSEFLASDVNGDGAVNIQDLVFVASRLGRAAGNKADVNGDGAVNIQDLVFVAGELGGAAAAPSVWYHTSFGVPPRATVEQWLLQARGLLLTDARSQRGVLLLERFLAALTPKETALLENYPNPFNPETWIPYHLAEPAAVTLTIYSVDGKVVRRLDLGHQAAGFYQSKSRAAYWDGRNNVGERVASGLYFYTLKAGDFAATGKMLIRK